jgi:5,10-methylenetetrahydromethanopterin reductase
VEADLVRPEFWLAVPAARSGLAAQAAARAEADGWDGMTVADTQCLYGDPFVTMTAAAAATDRLKISISTSNPATRHPSVAASAMASVQEIAGDRVRFGIGRGDSALAYIGGAPASVSMFERYVVAVRKYLHGHPVSYESIREWRLTEDVSTIQLDHAPADSVIEWLDGDRAPVPIDVYATGPQVLGVGGRSADGVVMSVGSDRTRLQWAMDVARAQRKRAGLDPSSLSFTAICIVSVSSDLERARRAVANVVAATARFAVMSGHVVGPMSDEQRQVYEAIGRVYDMTRHGDFGAQVDVLTPEFIDTHAIIGSPALCVRRIMELVDLGISSFLVDRPRIGADDDLRAAYHSLVDEVLPEVRARAEVR